MKKHRLEDINKSQVFTEPPEGYFDKLPGILQARTANKPVKTARLYWVGALKLIPAAAAIVLIVLYSGLLNQKESAPGFEEMLSEVTSDDILQYLEELDLTSEEILDEVDLRVLSLEFEDMEDPLIDNLDIEDETLLQMYDDFDLQDSLL
jgi:hypothetical protein